MIRRAALLLAAVPLVSACGSGPIGAALSASSLGLPIGDARPIAQTTVYTSPDGGIYRNPDHLDILMASTIDPTPLSALGTDASRWDTLRPLGRFTAVAVRLRNDGKTGSDPELDDLQIASDLAPAGTDRGPLRHWYHPTWPLAAVADRRFSGNCKVHLDPGQSAVVVLIYPPVQAAGGLVWGRYSDFALRLPLAGRLSGLGGEVRSVACDPPAPPPVPPG